MPSRKTALFERINSMCLIDSHTSRLRPRMWRMLTLCVGVLLGAVLQAQSITSDALSKLNFRMPTLNMMDDIKVDADRMSADHQQTLATLHGNVIVTFSDITLTCEKATYNYQTGNIHAEGDVKIVSKAGGSWQGDSIDFNHKTGEGLIGTGLLKLGQFSVLADSLARDEDGVAYSRNATVTTCTNEMHSWHWSVTGEGRYKDKEFLELKNAVVRLGGVPVLWAPYYYRDLNTHYGWRFRPGYSSKWGFYLLTGYVYPIAGSYEDDGLLYGKTVVDLRSEYGVAAGQEFTWFTNGGFLGEDTIQRGYLSIYVADHSETQQHEDLNWQSPYKDYRYSIGLRERIDFSPRDHISIAGEYLSDSEFRSDYKEISVREAAQSAGIFNYEHRENTWVSAVTLAGPLNSFYGGVRRLPEFRLDTLPKNVFDIPNLYYESQTSVGWYSRQPGKNSGALEDRYRYNPGNWAYFESARLDTRHIFRRPYTLAEGVTLTPRLGWRGTYYSDSPDGGNYFRSLFELGATLQARYWKDFENYRHTMMPYVDFTFVPGSQQSADEIPYAFDRIDQEYEWHDRFASDGMTPTHRYTGLRFGVRNLLQKRAEDNTLSRYLNWDLYGVFVAQTQDHWVRWTHRDQPGRDNYRGRARRVEEETGFRVLGLDAVYSPTRKLDVLMDVQYDPAEGRLAYWDIGLRAKMDKITYYIGYLRRDHDMYDFYWTDTIEDALIYGGFIHHVCDTFDWSLYLRHNIERSELEEIGGFVQYNLDCISFRLNLEYLMDYVSEDGYKHDSDFRISLGAWLRVFPKEDDHDWMEWGNLTNMRLLGEIKE